MFTSLNLKHSLLKLENGNHISCDFPNVMVITVRDSDGEGYIELPVHQKYNKENTATLLKLVMLSMNEGVNILSVAYSSKMPKHSQVNISTVIGFFPDIKKEPDSEIDWIQLKAVGPKKDWDDQYWELRGYNPNKDEGGKYRETARKLKEQADRLNKEMKRLGIIDKRAEFKVYFKRKDS